MDLQVIAAVNSEQLSIECGMMNFTQWDHVRKICAILGVLTLGEDMGNIQQSTMVYF